MCTDRASLHFLQHVCEETAVFEAMIMENFIACNVGIYVYTKRSEDQSERAKDDRKNYKTVARSVWSILWVQNRVPLVNI